MRDPIGKTGIWFGLFAVLLCAQGAQGQGWGDAFSEPPTNLKVLKVDKPEDLRPIMRSFNRSPGVQRRFCHDTDDFAKDIPHKETAREMIEMVNKINSEVFTWERAPRATCHMPQRRRLSPVQPACPRAAQEAPPGSQPRP